MGAVAQGHRTDNPAGDTISAALPNNNAQVTHRAALPQAEVGAAVAKVRRSGAYRGAVLSFEFLVLTAARSAEVRGATWDEIDVEAAVWTIPAQRMKAAREHRVPLSDRALVVLDEARRDLPRAGNLVFPSQKGRLQGHHPMGKMMRKPHLHQFRHSRIADDVDPAFSHYRLPHPDPAGPPLAPLRAWIDTEQDHACNALARPSADFRDRRASASS